MRNKPTSYDKTVRFLSAAIHDGLNNISICIGKYQKCVALFEAF